MSEAQTQTQDQNAANAAGAAAAAANAANAVQTTQQQQNGQQHAADKSNGAADKSIAAGGDKQTQQQEQTKSYWPEDWRQKVAEHAAAGNKKAMEKELKRLESINDPTGIYTSFRTLENTWASRNFVKKPGDDAKPEEIAEYHKALGVPEKPEDYFKSIKLENGAVIGEADKPLADSFAAAVHKSGATPAVVNAAMNWYFGNQEQQAAALDEADEKFKTESTNALKDDFGSAFKRKTNAIASLFEFAPGGADAKNEKSLFARLMGGRTADGKIIGNDPDMTRFMVALALERNPSASVVDDGDQTGKSIEAEIEDIKKYRRENKNAYYKDEKRQARFRDLLEAQQKIRAR